MAEFASNIIAIARVKGYGWVSMSFKLIKTATFNIFTTLYLY